MKAAQITEYGDKSVLKTVVDAPKPKAAAGQVLVAVHAAAVNPFDWKVREGQAQAYVPLKFPATLGSDFAGVIEELGEGVNGLSVGMEVYGQANALGGEGSFAEFVPVKAESVAPKPKKLDFVTAAALPLAGVSTYQALVEEANLQAGQKVLIHGGAGGIGSYAIQLAKHLKAYVATTAAADDADFVKNLGADEVIDYTSQDFSTLLQDYDVVYDTVGGDTYTKSYQVLKPGGILISMTEQPNEELAAQHQVTAIAQQTRTTTERLTKLAELVDQGAIKPQIDKVFPLEEASQALAYIQEGKHRGKVVIKVN
ncbi:MAG: hypothetical protein JWS12_245 [Candidatus Saccharibacteria bacterium]|nr:hypothetical protein [Candidatus Saccharibacteria bacterium]